MRSIRVVRSIVVAGVLTIASMAAGSEGEQRVGPSSRAEATAIVEEMRRIVTLEGVERLEKIHIGGIDQWISVRGFDRRNPILLFH
jgi:proline iminopeptidase